MMSCKELVDWLDQHPDMRNMVETFIKAVENQSGNLQKVDEMEEFLFKELHNGGQILFTEWAKKRESEQSKIVSDSSAEAKKHGKKKSHLIPSLE